METSAAMTMRRGKSAVGLRIGGEIDGEFKGGETGSREKERGEVGIGKKKWRLQTFRFGSIAS
jgi:hypothetical protein